MTWQEVKLNSLGTINRGRSRHRPRNDNSLFGGSYPFIQTADVKNNTIIKDFSQTYNAIGLKQSKLWPEGSILITIAANIFEVSLLGIDACFPDSIVGFIANKNKVNVRYIFYNLNNLKREIQNEYVGSGSVQDNINLQHIGNLTLSIPPLPEQREIAAILGALDDKIENNRKTAATLEGMARALYRSWFVDFDPVHARAEGRTPAHMDAATAALFPDRFGEDGLPEGWKIRTLSTMGNIITGKTPSTKDSRNYGEFCPFIKIPDMHKNMYIINTKNRLSKKGASLQPRQSLPTGSIVVSCIATPGLVSITTNTSHTNQQINSIIPSDEFSTEFIYWSCRHIADLKIFTESSGSVFHNLSKSKFSSLPCLIPTKNLHKKFTGIVTPWHKKILSLSNESQTLATLRDTLLPRLMSGELRVSAAKEMVEEASS